MIHYTHTCPYCDTPGAYVNEDGFVDGYVRDLEGTSYKRKCGHCGKWFVSIVHKAFAVCEENCIAAPCANDDAPHAYRDESCTEYPDLKRCRVCGHAVRGERTPNYIPTPMPKLIETYEKRLRDLSERAVSRLRTHVFYKEDPTAEGGGK